MPPHIATLSYVSSDSRILLTTSSSSCEDGATNGTQKSLKKLNAEVQKLKAIAAFTQAEAEETVSNEKDATYAQIDEKRLAIGALKIKKGKIIMEIEEEEGFIRYSENLLAEQKEALTRAEEDRLQLERMLNELKKESEEYQSKCEKLEEIVRTMNRSVEELLREQDKIVESTKRNEQVTSGESDRQINLLKRLLENELEMKRESVNIRTVARSDTSEEGIKLVDIMNAQRERMLTSFTTV